MCIKKQPKLTNKYEYIVYHVTRAIIEPVAPGIFVQYDKPLIPVSKPLGSDKQRGDAVISGLLSFPDGVGISVKGQPCFAESLHSPESVPRCYQHI